MNITELVAKPLIGDDMDIVEITLSIEVEATDVGKAAAQVLAALDGDSPDYRARLAQSDERVNIASYLLTHPYRAVSTLAEEILAGEHLEALEPVPAEADQ